MDTSATETPAAATLFDDAGQDGVRPLDNPAGIDSAADTDSAAQAPFDDGKDPQALRTIGEVAKALSLRPHVLRYWEEQFPALQPIKRSGNRRYYRPQDIALIAQIDRLVHGEGYTLRGAARAIEDNAVEPQKPVPVPADRPVSPGDGDFLRRLAEIRAELADALARS